jgi:hypothetical protein
MNTPELIVWLIPGYLAVLVYRHVNPQRSKQGYEWFFQTGAAGVLCFIVARILIAIGYVLLPVSAEVWLHTWRESLLPFNFRFSLTFAIGLCPGWMIAAAALCVGRRIWDRLLRFFAETFKASNYNIDLFLYRCRQLKGALIFVTLDTRKVYVGVLTDYTEDLDDPERYIVILPWRSGFREKDTLQVVFTTDYASEAESEETFKAEEIIIPTKQITSLGRFNPDLDLTFQDRGMTRVRSFDELRAENTSAAGAPSTSGAPG